MLKNIFDNVSVDAAKAGSGNLEIMVNGGLVDCEVTDLGHQRFRAHFVPQTSTPHVIDMRFNSQAVPGKNYLFYKTETAGV